MTAQPSFVSPLSHGIHLIDTGFHRPAFDASYLIVEDGRAAFVDTGTNHAVPRLLEAVRAVGLTLDDVEYVIATHVHLDHAGGVGSLMRELPRARLVVHPRGAIHLIDPRKLVQGARAVYGDDEFARSYGTIVPVPAARVITTSDGFELTLGRRPLHFIDTPGHARHHHAIWDEASRGWFTGDTFGLSYREFDSPRGAWLLPTTTPVQFEPEALENSVKRLMDRRPDWLYLTHYGRVGEVPRLGAEFLEQLAAMVKLGHAVRGQPQRHAALCRGLEALYAERVARHGSPLTPVQAKKLLALDVELNAQGMGVWLDR